MPRSLPPMVVCWPNMHFVIRQASMSIAISNYSRASKTSPMTASISRQASGNLLRQQRNRFHVRGDLLPTICSSDSSARFRPRVLIFSVVSRAMSRTSYPASASPGKAFQQGQVYLSAGFLFGDQQSN